MCEHVLVKVAVRGHVGVHGGLSHCSRPQELSFVFVIHEKLLARIGMLKCPSRLINQPDLCPGVATSLWCLQIVLVVYQVAPGTGGLGTE